MSKYKNKNILVIGASFGIGEELCRQLAAQGSNLAIVARSLDKIERLCDELEGKNFAIPCDVTKKADIDRLLDIVQKRWQKIDLVIFCAGIYKPMNLENFDLEKARNIVDVNFTSLFGFIDSFMGMFKEEKIAHLAVISSVAGYFGMPNSLAYGASKAGLSNLCESLSYELKKYKTKVQLINPGFVKSRLTDQNDFKMPGIISSEKAAKIILKQLKTDKFEIKFPFLFALVMKIFSLLPYKLRFALLGSKINR